MAGRVRERFHAARFIGLLGVALRDVTHGRVSTSLETRPDLQRSDGRVHPGVVAAMAEHSAMAAAMTHSPVHSVLRTTSLALEFKGETDATKLECIATVVAFVDTQATVCVEISGTKGSTRTPVASGTVDLELVATSA